MLFCFINGGIWWTEEPHANRQNMHLVNTGMTAYPWVRWDSSPPCCWSHCCCSSSSSQRWGLPFEAPSLWLSASSEPTAWRLIGWERWGRVQAEDCFRRRGCRPLRRNLGPGWGRGGPQGSGCSLGPRTLLWGTSDRPGPVRMMTQVWALLSSAAPSSGCRLPSADGSAEVLAASVSVASAGLRLRWTEGELQLHL